MYKRVYNMFDGDYVLEKVDDLEKDVECIKEELVTNNEVKKVVNTNKLKASKMIVDLLVEFDELGFAPTEYFCDCAEEYAINWKKKLLKALKEFGL